MPPASLVPRPTSRASRHAAKRASILEAASRVFGSRVYHLVSMEDVARTAGVGKGTLYRYFPSKEDLYLAIVDAAFDLLVRRLTQEQAAVGLPPTTVLRRMVAAIVETFARHLSFFRLLQHGEARLFLKKKQVIRARREHIARLLAVVLDMGVAAGAFRKLDPVLGPSMLIGMVWGTTLNHAEEVPAEVLASRVTDLYLHGLLQAPGDLAR